MASIQNQMNQIESMESIESNESNKRNKVESPESPESTPEISTESSAASIPDSTSESVAASVDASATESYMHGSLCKQLDKGQDLAVHGKYEKGYYIGVFDGHGTHKCIDILRGLDYSVIANDPLKIINWTNEWLYNSGSTMNFTTIQVEDEIIVTNYNAGDSECIIFVNGKLVFESVSHTLYKPGERARLIPFLNTNKPYTGGWAPIPLSDTRITVQRSDICNFKTGESIVPTMSLGHNNMTGFDPDVVTMRFKLTDHVRIISGSDGFWGMIIKSFDEDKLKTYTLEQLIDFAEARWRQEWEYAADNKNTNNFEKTRFPGYDDIAVSVWDNQLKQDILKRS